LFFEKAFYRFRHLAETELFHNIKNQSEILISEKRTALKHSFPNSSKSSQ
jgi:hypothetical protein